MHLPLIANLVASLLPHLSRDSGSTITAAAQPSTLVFRPIHAHAQSYHSTQSPRLLIHNASSSQVSYLSTSASDLDGSYAPLAIRTKRMKMRRPRTRPPNMISWALSARDKRLNPKSPLPWSPTRALPLSGRGGSAVGHNETMWQAPDYEDAGGDWEDVEVDAPDVSDRQTLITLAKMTSNAYVLPDSGEWWPVGSWNATIPFGWEADADGLRGHVFADPTNSTVIISIKGTSAGVLGSGGPTAKNDKYNDNLLFSCCCARVDFSWTPVCDCYAGGYKCEQTCLEDALIAESVYATVGTNLYNNVTYMYPNATIWLTGHSLGGSVSALIGLSFGAPVVTYEAPGDLLAAKRLHLPLPPGMPADKSGITHVYHTADPIPMGACTGAYSGCYAAGFALEAKCHTGETILYDTVTVKGWAVDVRTHRIGEIINKVLADPWPGTEDDPEELGKSKSLSNQEGGNAWTSWWGWGRRGPPKKGPIPGDPNDDDGGWQSHGGVPRAKAEDECVDCFKWEFGDGWNKKPKEK